MDKKRFKVTDSFGDAGTMTGTPGEVCQWLCWHNAEEPTEVYQAIAELNRSLAKGEDTSTLESYLSILIRPADEEKEQD